MITCRNLEFQYPGESFSLHIRDLEIGEREKVAVIGPSGCGKTTLLRLISGVLLPRQGEVRIGDCAVNRLPARKRHAFRLRNIGLVQQEFELLDYLTVLENVLLPFRVSSAVTLDGGSRDRADLLLERVGMERHRNRLPDQLSQGERQRIAICRGLVTSPGLILADEPTGNLDPDNQARTVELLLGEAEEIGATVVMVTHEPTLLGHFQRTINLLDVREAGPVER